MSRLPWAWGDTGSTTTVPVPSGFEGRHGVRAVRVDAPPAVVFRWLTQMAVAPYSYDLVDNRGRRSPRRLVAGCEPEVGRVMMEIFTLTAVEPDRLLELRMSDPGAVRVFGQIAVVYRTLPEPGGTRLRCDLFVPPASGAARVRHHLLAWGDLVMMRKQLLTFKELSEQSVGSHPRGFSPDLPDA